MRMAFTIGEDQARPGVSATSMVDIMPDIDQPFHTVRTYYGDEKAVSRVWYKTLLQTMRRQHT